MLGLASFQLPVIAVAGNFAILPGFTSVALLPCPFVISELHPFTAIVNAALLFSGLLDYFELFPARVAGVGIPIKCTTSLFAHLPRLSGVAIAAIRAVFGIVVPPFTALFIDASINVALSLLLTSDALPVVPVPGKAFRLPALPFTLLTVSLLALAITTISVGKPAFSVLIKILYASLGITADFIEHCIGVL